jgi:hypothetical protein
MRLNVLFILAVVLLCQCTTQRKQIPVKSWAETYQVATGRPVSMALTVYKTTMIANGTDKMIARVAAIDSTGREIKDAAIPFTIHVTGDATISGEGLTAVKTDSTTHWEAKLVNGLFSFTFQAGTKPDKIKLEVRGEKTWPVSHEIHTLPSTFKNLKPTEDQLKPTGKVIDRMLGADISFLPQMENRGAKFIINGKETDAVNALADNGFNYIRLRIFVNPENEKGYDPTTGFCGLEATKKMAKRVKDAGMKLLLDFHYSDYWADPQQQFKPLAWEKMNIEQLETAVKDYTKSVLLALQEQGTMPDMVQVGNEINHGLLWPDGHISNPDNLAALLKAGIEGVNEVNPATPIMMHLALGGQNEEAVFWLDNMIARDVKFDVIGLSYYPRWHGTLDDLQRNIFDLAERYGKPINVVEYSQYAEELNDIIFSLPDNLGKGTCNWEPLRAMFGKSGVANENLFVYSRISAKYFK